MKPSRSAIAVLSLAALAACQSDLVQAPVPVEAPLAIPSAYAAAANTTTQTICTSPGNTELSFDGITWVPAELAGDLGYPYGAVLPGSSWVGPYVNSGLVSATAPGVYLFRTTFELPVGSKNVSLSGAVHADNWATLSLNGVQFFAQTPVVQYASFQDPPDLFSTAKEFVDGLNVVKATLVNAAGADNVASSTAIDYCFTVSYVAPGTTGGGDGDGTDRKGCPAASTIAAQYLQSMGLQPTTSQGRNIVALVADHMTRGAQFEGLDKCDPGYAPAVIAYVDARLP